MYGTGIDVWSAGEELSMSTMWVRWCCQQSFELSALPALLSHVRLHAGCVFAEMLGMMAVGLARSQRLPLFPGSAGM